jgi:cell division protein FtsI/penicillin-binding protein 2
MPSRRLRSAAAVSAAALLMSGCGVLGGGGGGGSGRKADDNSPRGVAQGFLDEWSAARYPEASERTTDSTAAAAALTDMQAALHTEKRTFDLGNSSGDCAGPNGCTFDFDADLILTGLGEWRYSSALQVAQIASGAKTSWKVKWAPSILHPAMTDATAFSRVRQLPPRAPILDRHNALLVTQQPVMRVGVKAGAVPDGTVEELADKTNINIDGLTTRVANAENGDFVEAVVLRQSDYLALKPKLDKIPGVVVEPDTLTLAPTRAFAREVLGSVGTATPAALASAGPTADPEDSVGLFGLQALYQKQLAGRAGGRVDLVNKDTGAPVQTLIEFSPVDGTAVHTTLDLSIQNAAENALTLTDENSSLVAIDVTTGNVLAVANGPEDKAGEDRALNGQYAPGTGFKLVDALALLQNGVGLNDKIGCAPSVTIEGKRFDNYDGIGAPGQQSLAANFARSCSTAFARRIADLPTDSLSKAADALGLENDWELLVDSFSGSVPPASDRLDLANAAVGQGRMLVSPLAMAMMAAAVASGTPRYPRLVLDGPPAQTAPPANPAIVPPPGTVATASPSPTSPAPTPTFSPDPDDRPALDPLPYAAELKSLMMRATHGGTGSILGVGSTVGAFSGTALYGSDTEPGHHAWMIGFVGNVAFAVIVERGTTGPATAGPIAKNFLDAIL